MNYVTTTTTNPPTTIQVKPLEDKPFISGFVVIPIKQLSPCDRCSNNPKNGGSGICFCTLGSPKVTC